MNIASTLSKKKVNQIDIYKFIQKLNFPFIIFNFQSMYKFDTIKFICGVCMRLTIGRAGQLDISNLSGVYLKNIPILLS